MWAPGLGELLIIFAIVLVMFGGGKIAGVGKSLGTAISEFKQAVNEDKKEIPAEEKKEEAPSE